MKTKCLVIGLSSLVAGLTFSHVIDATPAIADSDENPAVVSADDEARNRWVLGIGILGGRPVNNDCADCYTSFGVGMYAELGRMLTPRLALMLDTHAVAVGQSDVDTGGVTGTVSANVQVQGVVAIAVQYWPSERFWIKGGIGQGEVRGSATVVAPSGASADILETQTGFGTLAAAGYELYHGPKLGVELQARFAGLHGDGLNRGNLVLGLGVGWYP